MTIKMDKEEQQDPQEESESVEPEETEPEAEPVESVLCIQLFCIDEKYEMRCGNILFLFWYYIGSIVY